MRYLCAQAGCQVCMEGLLREHDGLVQWVIRRDCRSDLAYAELVHEGQIALWQAIMHYDPGRGVAFSTYAVPAIRHRLWRLVQEAERPQGRKISCASQEETVRCHHPLLVGLRRQLLWSRQESRLPRLTSVQVPLRTPDADVPLDLQAALSVIFDEFDYGRTTDYSVSPPPPPLSEHDKAWLATQLVAAGSRV